MVVEIFFDGSYFSSIHVRTSNSSFMLYNLDGARSSDCQWLTQIQRSYPRLFQNEWFYQDDTNNVDRNVDEIYIHAGDSPVSDRNRPGIRIDAPSIQAERRSLVFAALANGNEQHGQTGIRSIQNNSGTPECCSVWISATKLVVESATVGVCQAHRGPPIQLPNSARDAPLWQHFWIGEPFGLVGAGHVQRYATKL